MASLERRGSSSSQSSTNVKPSHRGRVIKDGRANSLDPLGRGPQPPVSKRGNSADIIADGNGLSGRPDNLKKRVHELEKENGKLRRSLDEAEVSIQTYRSFLSAKSTTANCSVAVQTDSPGDIRQRDPDDALRKENRSLKAQTSTLQQSIADVTANLETVTKKKMEAERASQIKIDELLAHIKSLESVNSSTVSLASDSPGNRYKSFIEKLRKKSSLHTRKYHDTKDTITAALNDFNHFMRHTTDLLVNEVRRREKEIRESAKPQVRSPVKTPKTKTGDKTSPSKKTPKNQQLKTLLSEAGCSPMPVVKLEQVDRSTDPLSPMKLSIASSPTTINLVDDAEDEDNAEKEKLAADTLQRQKELDEAHREKDTTIALMMKSLEAATEKYESEKMMLEAEANREATSASDLSNRLVAASREFQNVLTKFGKEIHAVKHLSHCKDLVRIAGLRELGLEKDRLVNEMKYAKYVVGRKLIFPMH